MSESEERTSGHCSILEEVEWEKRLRRPCFARHSSHEDCLTPAITVTKGG